MFEMTWFKYIALYYIYDLALHYYLVQIREGRFQTLDQCLVREYRMSLQGVTKQVSNDFCEVHSS